MVWPGRYNPSLFGLCNPVPPSIQTHEDIVFAAPGKTKLKASKRFAAPYIQSLKKETMVDGQSVDSVADAEGKADTFLFKNFEQFVPGKTLSFRKSSIRVSQARLVANPPLLKM